MTEYTPENAANWLYNNGLACKDVAFAVVCGSGLAQAMDNFVETVMSWQFKDIPGFPEITVSGHSGKMNIVKFMNSGVLALVFLGRVHLYEGIDIEKLLFQVRLVNALKIKRLVITCSVGSVNRRTLPGSLGLITEHVDLQLNRPFCKTKTTGIKYHTKIYDRDLIEIFERSALTTGIELTSGTLYSVLGPAYETPAEVSMIKRLGGDWVSMSTAKEAFEAHKLAIRTVGITGIANFVNAYPEMGEVTTHNEVLDAAKKSSKALWALLSSASADLS